MMKCYCYHALDTASIAGFSKAVAALEVGDFQRADAEKLTDNLYSARLNKRDRLLFSLYRYQGERVILLLEHIRNHAYDRSRFLQQLTTIQPSKIVALPNAEDAPNLVYINPQHSSFHLLDKIISFDDSQQPIYELEPPVIIIGSAGSGKTALTLEKMKQAIGDVLYVTLSPFLVRSSRDIYYAHGFEDDSQQVDFLSYQEFLESIQVPAGREVQFRDFYFWFKRQRCPKEVSDSYKLYEEFKGVMTGTLSEQAALTREEYLGLGIKQSIFNHQERAIVYDLFERFYQFMDEQGWYDSNVISHRYLQHTEPRYDFVVVDEVQDLTNVQLNLIMASLNDGRNFLICGDSNQIVHPNFFSWAKVKSYFHQQSGSSQPRELIRVLNKNYRNSPQVTAIANRLLKIKQARFGSIDRESNYLVESNGHQQGGVHFVHSTPDIVAELEQKTCSSTKFAIVVLRDEDKPTVRKRFSTPLVFSVREAKGLEYDNIILLDFISGNARRFNEIIADVDEDDLMGELRYARAKSKTDKSLEAYKFHINALYVAITRAICSIYIVEHDSNHRLFHLLGMDQAAASLDMTVQASDLDAWREEAQKLAQQGKDEQAEEIRSRILKQKKVPWTPISKDNLRERIDQARASKKQRLPLFEYALLYDDRRILFLLELMGFKGAQRPEEGMKNLRKRYLAYQQQGISPLIRRHIKEYGVDYRDEYNATPLMLAARFGNAPLIEYLCQQGADTTVLGNNGLNPFHIAIHAIITAAKTPRKFSEALHLLAPAELTIQVDGKLIKIGKHLMEFTMFHIAMAIFPTLARKVEMEKGFQAADFVDAAERLPETIVPARRKKRSYISSMLSKNERLREDRYNRKLFHRLQHGCYMLNPCLQIRIGDAWHKIYDILDLERITLQSLVGVDAEEEALLAGFPDQLLVAHLRELEREGASLLAKADVPSTMIDQADGGVPVNEPKNSQMEQPCLPLVEQPK